MPTGSLTRHSHLQYTLFEQLKIIISGGSATFAPIAKPGVCLSSVFHHWGGNGNDA
jgi:hypothetical protein